MELPGIRERGGGATRIDQLAFEALACTSEKRAGFYAAVAREYGQGFADRLQERMEDDRAWLGEERAAREAAKALGRPVEGVR
ncbi:hypothetical protein AUC70_11780 [Methyloceanibacter stevinii]|uniref:Uncharacterized protein n=2 Tax=Methyloceanibacter stevinii TaxID=1774970 RepID=A0A1E3VKP3_9HYPH|nr:hypothetical protein AUC70_11780 [Methyloceanibacter stevinii]